MEKLGLIIMVAALAVLNSCTKPDVMKNKLVVNLNSAWAYEQVDGDYKGKASVPGTIHTDLLANKQIEDPFYRTNEKDLQWIDKEDWIYQTMFDVEADLLNKDRIDLHFYGLDTYADVFLNDTLILKANNMHREWNVDIKPWLKNEGNKLKVYFHSPIKKGVELYDASPFAYPAVNDQSENGGLGDKKVSVFTRKAGYHYGWDWGPRFVTSGIWRPVQIRGWDDADIESIYIKQEFVDKEQANLTAELMVNSENELEVTVLLVNLTDDNIASKKELKLIKGRNQLNLNFDILQPKLWWSNGLGDPHMYEFEAQLKINDKIICSEKVKTGLRSIKLIREKDSEGEGFAFELNGVRVFAKGANYIPNDSFLPSVTKKDYQKVIADAVNANMNMLRVWGGGVYEDDYFYELCDENGIMVWQDFMFACSMYPGDKEFLDNVRAEAIDNVIRLRNHPSIALWCGNNEMNTAWHYYSKGGWGWKDWYTKDQQDSIQEAYLNVFHKILPDVLDEKIVGVDYWPSSPQAGYEPDQHASYETTSGDMHYWGVWHGLHAFEDFDKYKSRFMSEYGFQSFPELTTVKTYAKEEDFNIESDVMAAHQRSGIGNLRIKEYLSWYYHVPEDFEQFLYMSQVLQAHGIRMAIEAHRRAMPYCMGSLYWQINDCWPVASWSSTDYNHNWKAVHYAVKKAYEPVLISTVNSRDHVQIFIVSDKLKDIKTDLEIEVMDFKGNRLFSETRSAKIKANTRTRIEDFIFNKQTLDTQSCFMLLTLRDNNKVLSSKIHYFDKPKNLKLIKPEINIERIESAGKKLIKVKSNVLVPGLYIYSDDGILSLDENYFDLLPNSEKIIGLSVLDTIIGDYGIKYRHLLSK